MPTSLNVEKSESVRCFWWNNVQFKMFTILKFDSLIVQKSKSSKVLKNIVLIITNVIIIIMITLIF